MAKKKRLLHEGDVFTVLLSDDDFAVGQVVGQEKSVLNSVSCIFFDLKLPTTEEASKATSFSVNQVIASLFVTRDLLDAGVWATQRSTQVPIPKEMLPYESLRGSGFVGAKAIGSNNVAKFLEAFHQLRPWDEWHDPCYLDTLLISPDKKPHHLIYTKTTAWG